MKTRLYCLAFVLAFAVVSCTDNKPRPFLKEKEMAALLTEIRLTEARLYNHRDAGSPDGSDVMADRSMEVYIPIFQKYGLNYDQYLALMRYYMSRPEKLTAIYEASAENLRALVDEKRVADSIEQASRSKI